MDGKAIMSAGAGWLITETTMNGPHLFAADHRDLMGGKTGLRRKSLTDLR